MSKELLPELPKPELVDDEIGEYYSARQMRAYGQACYEAGRKSVDLEQFREAIELLLMTNSFACFEQLHFRRLLAIIDGEK